MPVDMKVEIAKAARKLLLEKGVKKLTVKDIVEECQITRQAFYYHFEDIPALFRWMFEQNIAKTILEAKALENGEARLRCLFVLALSARPYVKKGMKSNYRDELEQYLRQYILSLFEQLCEAEGLYQDWHWTDDDTKNLDQVVHTAYLLITEGIPKSEKK